MDPDDLRRQAQSKRDEAGSYRDKADFEDKVLSKDRTQMENLAKDAAKHETDRDVAAAKATQLEQTAQELEQQAYVAEEQQERERAAQAAAAAAQIQRERDAA